MLSVIEYVEILSLNNNGIYTSSALRYCSFLSGAPRSFRSKKSIGVVLDLLVVMPAPAIEKRAPVIPIVVGIIVVIGLIAGVIYLRRTPQKPVESAVSREGTAYLSHLSLSDVSMQASENFMKQQVIEVKGKITDNGSRSLKTIEVYCLFYGPDGREIHRERLAILNSTAAPLRPGETRAFRLPFDAVPDGWNQALPKMVIAQITFAQ